LHRDKDYDDVGGVAVEALVKVLAEIGIK